MGEELQARLLAGEDIAADFAPYALTEYVDNPDEVQAYGFVFPYAVRQDVIVITRAQDETRAEVHPVFYEPHSPAYSPSAEHCSAMTIDHRIGSVVFTGMKQAEQANPDDNRDFFFNGLRLQVFENPAMQQVPGLISPLLKMDQRLRLRLSGHLDLGEVLKRVLEGQE